MLRALRLAPFALRFPPCALRPASLRQSQYRHYSGFDILRFDIQKLKILNNEYRILTVKVD
jgi:hypothetical protein